MTLIWMFHLLAQLDSPLCQTSSFSSRISDKDCNPSVISPNLSLFSLKLQELEVENGKMRDDLKKLRDALSDEAGEDNAQFKEMIGELARDFFSKSLLTTFFGG